MQQHPHTYQTTAELARSVCTCLVPIRQERAERKGVARTYCDRCGLPIPPRFSVDQWR